MNYVISGPSVDYFIANIAEELRCTGSAHHEPFVAALGEGVVRIRVMHRFAVFVVSDKCERAVLAIREASRDERFECHIGGALKSMYGIRDFWAVTESEDGLAHGVTSFPKASTMTTAAPKADRRNVERVGRILGDGSRRGARTVRRLTVYLPADLAHRLELESAMTGDQKSEIVSRSLAKALAQRTKGGTV